MVGTSQMYTTESARPTGVESVKANGSSTDVREL